MQNFDTDQNDMLGLSFLMNNKKKTYSDASSISSGRSSLVDRDDEISIKADVIDVSNHLSKEPYHQSRSKYQEEEETEEEETENQESDQEETSLDSASVQSKRRNTRGNYMSDEDIINAKKELLYQFERLEKKGVRLPKKFTLASSYEEMKMEYERLKRDREIDGSVKFQRRMTMAAISGIEFVSTNYLTFMGAKLDGWSEKMYEDIDDYDDVFEELHEKYKTKGKIPPELRLIGGIGGSALMFHMTNRYASTLPGLDQVLKNNPELARKLAEATAETQNQQQNTSNSFFGNLFSGMFGGNQGASGSSEYAQGGQATQYAQATQQAPIQKVKLKGPSTHNIEDILADLEKSNNNDRIDTLSIISGSDDDEESINDMIMGNKKGKKGYTLDI
jgi:hypothetical protein